MWFSRVELPLAVFFVLCLSARDTPAQQVTVSTPHHMVGHGFYEQIGTHWGINGRGFSFSFGSPNMALPPFGGFDPNAGLRGGFYGPGGFFNFAANQGSRQSFVSQTPSLTLMNGQSGFIFDTTLSPFVMGYVPVVGGFPTVGYVNPMMGPPGYGMSAPSWVPPSVSPGNDRVQAMLRRNRAVAGGLPQPPTAKPPIKRRAAGDMDLLGNAPASRAADGDRVAQRLAATRSSSAGRPVLSVAEARRLHQIEREAMQKEAMALFERGRAAEERGQVNLAKSLYSSALKRATGSLHQRVQARLDALGSSKTP